MGLSADCSRSRIYRASMPEVSMAPALGSAEPLRPELPDEGSPSQTRSSIQKSASRQISGQKNCWLLVCAFLLGSMAARSDSGNVRSAAFGLDSPLFSGMEQAVCCRRSTGDDRSFWYTVSYIGFCGNGPSAAGIFCTGAGSDLPVCHVLRAGKRNADPSSCLNCNETQGDCSLLCCLLLWQPMGYVSLERMLCG